MKTYKFVIEDNSPVCFYVEPEMVARLRNKYGNVYNTKADCLDAIRKATETSTWLTCRRHLSDAERKQLEKEQWLFAKSMFTEEDWAIVHENREKRKGIDKIQLEFGREMMRRERREHV